MSLSRAGAGVAAAALGGLAVLGMQTSASAAPGDCPAGRHYAPVSGCVANGASLDHRNFTPGQPGHLTAPGFKPGSVADLTLHSTPTFLGSYHADSAGVVDADFTVPSTTPAGSHKLVLAGVDPSGATFSVGIPIVVAAIVSSGTTHGTSTSASSGIPSLPRTGAPLGLMAGTGSVLVAVGGVSLYASRRRRVLG